MKAAELETQLTKLGDITVINSDERLAAAYPHWVTLNADAYFSEQWNKALELFAGDALFHIQADAFSSDLAQMFSKYSSVREKHRIGVFEPHIDHTDQQYNVSGLRCLEPNMFEIPFTDSTCWFVHGDIVRHFSPIDLTVNRYGWGIDVMAAACCRLAGLRCVRDYTFTVTHPRGTGYEAENARKQMHRYFATAPLPVQMTIQDIFLDFQKYSVSGPIAE
jgi:hypothetical protein